MKNIVIINQPANNRGDEAAHKSLIKELNKRFPETNINIIFQSVSLSGMEEMKVNSCHNNYIYISNNSKGLYFIIKWGLRLKLYWLPMFHPINYKINNYIKKADLIISSPGGICMGLFQNWSHVYNLLLAIMHKKKLIYYSRSFGPFSNQTKWDKIFKEISYKILKKIDFISIRDSKTMNIADTMGIHYIPSIDTAFLDTPRVELPESIKKKLNKKEYIVFVPNSLVWHPAFRTKKTESIDGFYIDIFRLIFKKFNDVNILMLPQLFNKGGEGDESYFKKLTSEVNDDKIIILSDEYNSEIQQTLISKAKLIIGARYHSVVFAINNEIPFVALSYEHKISGLLRILNLDDYMIDIENIDTDEFDNCSEINHIEKIIEKFESKEQIKTAKRKAQEIAIQCMNDFCKRFSSVLD